MHGRVHFKRCQNFVGLVQRLRHVIDMDGRLTTRYDGGKEFPSMDCQYGCILSRSSRGSFGGRSGVVLRIVSGAEKKKHLIEAAPFGRLDQMLQTAERRRISAFDRGRLDQMLRSAVNGKNENE